MAILDTFAILFQTDAKKAADDVEDLNENLDDTKKSADGASDGMDGFKKSTSKSNAGISTMIKKIGSLIATYLALDKTIDTAMENAEKVDVIGKFAQVTGQSIVNIDAWGQAVARNDGSAESFRGTLEYLNESLADISLTGGGEAAEMLARLGINAFDAGGKVKSAFAILPEIADAFQKLSTTQSFQFGRKLGLDMGTILTLQQGRVAVEKLVERQKSLGAVTKENYKISATFDDQVDDTKRAFESLSTEATTELLPALTGILKILEYGIQWLRHNKSLVQGYFIGIAGVVESLAQ
jgi:TP901 family phage tail tape measure protein